MLKVFLTSQAQRDLKKICSSDRKKIQKRLLVLEETPLSGKKLSGKLSGSYSLKAWPYRIIYFFKKRNQAWVTHISHRQKAYKK